MVVYADELNEIHVVGSNWLDKDTGGDYDDENFIPIIFVL